MSNLFTIISPDGAEEVCLDCGVRRREVLEAAEDVGHGVGRHAGKVLTMPPELVAQPAKTEHWNECDESNLFWGRGQDTKIYGGHNYVHAPKRI